VSAPNKDQCQQRNSAIKQGEVHYMTDDALDALENRYKIYPSECRKIHVFYKKMNQIPNVFFCRQVLQVWRDECEKRAKTLLTQKIEGNNKT